MKVLFLTHRLPFAPNRGDRIRAYHLLEHLNTFADVSLFSLVHDDEEASSVGTVPCDDVTCARVPKWSNFVRGALALPSDRPLTHCLLHAPAARALLTELVQRVEPDIVFAFGSGMAHLALEPPLANRPFVLDMVDVDSEKWSEMAERTRWPFSQVYRRETRTLRRFEVLASRAALATLVVHEREGEVLERFCPEAHIEVVQNGIQVEDFKRPMPPAETRRVIFCGVMDYQPNAWGVQWFAERVWPMVRRRFPDAELQIVGANPTRAVRALASSDSSIEVTGGVARTQTFLWGAAVAVAPIHIARGMQNKVLEAVAAGLPVVVTPAVARGLPETLRPACRQGRSEQEFADGVIQLLSLTPDERLASTRAVGLEELSWTARLKHLERILNEALECADYGTVKARTSRSNAVDRMDSERVR